MSERTGGLVLARQLQAEGVDTIFGIPGVQIYHAVDGVSKTPGLNFVTTRHEQATAYMADGYARTTGDIGVCMVVPGPGVLNVTAALATAYACNSPVLLIAGQVPTTSMGRGNGALHEIEDQTGIIRSVTKWNAVARSADEVPLLIREAVRQLRTGTPKPVAVEIPPDILSAVTAVDVIPPLESNDRTHSHEPELRSTAPLEVEAAVQELSGAEWPIIWAGGGAKSPAAGRAIIAIAEHLDIPVVMTDNGLGAIPADHPLACNAFEARMFQSRADVVLAIGTRFMSRAKNAAALESDVALVSINSDFEAFREPRVPKHALHGDAAQIGSILAERLRSEVAQVQRGGSKVVKKARSWAREQTAELQPQRDYLDAIQQAVPRDAVMVSEFTQISYVAPIAYPFYTPDGNITPGYQGTLGYGYATALGAALGAPDRVVISVNGDGGFFWNIQELATAKKYEIACIAIVFDNTSYGNVARDQSEFFSGRTLGSDLVNPDFLELAASFGITGMKAEEPLELTQCIREAIEIGGPVLIHAPIGQTPNPWKCLL